MLHAIVSCNGLANSHAFRLENVFKNFKAVAVSPLRIQVVGH